MGWDKAPLVQWEFVPLDCSQHPLSRVSLVMLVANRAVLPDWHGCFMELRIGLAEGSEKNYLVGAVHLGLCRFFSIGFCKTKEHQLEMGFVFISLL